MRLKEIENAKHQKLLVKQQERYDQNRSLLYIELIERIIDREEFITTYNDYKEYMIDFPSRMWKLYEDNVTIGYDHIIQAQHKK